MDLLKKEIVIFSPTIEERLLSDNNIVILLKNYNY